MRTQKAFTTLLLTAAIALGTVATVQAADKVDGTWSWAQQGRRGGQGGNENATPRKTTLKLKSDGEKVTGTLTAPAGGRGGGGGGEPMPVEISDGKIKGSDLSFSVKREFNGNAIVTKYSGKLEGDKITGKVERPGRDGGEARSTDWTATREK